MNIKTTLLHTVLMVTLFFWMVPLIYMISVALRTPAQAFNPQLITWPITFANFITVISENPLVGIFANSLIITVSTVVLVVIIAALVSYAMSVLKIRGSMVFMRYF